MLGARAGAVLYGATRLDESHQGLVQSLNRQSGVCNHLSACRLCVVFGEGEFVHVGRDVRVSAGEGCFVRFIA